MDERELTERLRGMHQAVKDVTRGLERLERDAAEPAPPKSKVGEWVVCSNLGPKPCVVISPEEFEKLWSSPGHDLSPWSPRVGDRVWVDGPPRGKVASTQGYGSVSAIGNRYGRIRVAMDPGGPKDHVDPSWFEPEYIRPADFAPKEDKHPTGLKAWKEKYYSVEAKDVSREDAAAHCLRKWEGSRAEVLERYGLCKDFAGIRDEAGERLFFDDKTCALCTNCKCAECPLRLHLGTNCIVGLYSTWEKRGDPEPMIAALKAVVEKEKVPPPLDGEWKDEWEWTGELRKPTRDDAAWLSSTDAFVYCQGDYPTCGWHPESVRHILRRKSPDTILREQVYEFRQTQLLKASVEGYMDFGKFLGHGKADQEGKD